MLSSLYIKNYAIIDEIHLSFPRSLTTITGETGSGKSILLGALGLIMGERADTEKLYDKNVKCIVEGKLEIARYDLHDFFDRNNFDYSETLILRREISKQGKSRAFINDTPALLRELRSLSSHLIQQHQQFDTMEIINSDYQIGLVDALAENEKILTDYTSLYADRIDLINELKKRKEVFHEAKREQDYVEFQLREIDELNITTEDLDTLDDTYTQLRHADEIVENLSSFTRGLTESENTAVDRLRELRDVLESIEEYLPKGTDIMKRLDETILELEDVSRSAYDIADEVEQDPDKLQEYQEKIDGVQRLLKKHQLDEYHDIIAYRETLQEKLNSIEYAEDEINELKEKIVIIDKKLHNIADTLHEKRVNTIPSIEENVEEQLASLSMPHAQFIIDIKLRDEIGPKGKDDLLFLFNANKGGTPKNLKDVASGGEMSRLALVLSSLVAEAMTLPTLIFDEIDTGVSGDVSLKMGKILQSLAENHQIIVITHSPQIAAQGDMHYFVSKRVDENRTYTKINQLKDKERIKKIAIMLSRNPPTEAAKSNAEELLNLKKY